jgi:predicted TIM-barrel fold metal-dependent hydrolase
LPCILWGSDYPHFDSTYPGAYAAAQKTFDAASPDAAQKIVCENPRRFMALA